MSWTEKTVGVNGRDYSELLHFYRSLEFGGLVENNENDLLQSQN